MSEHDDTASLQAQLEAALSQRQGVSISGGLSKPFGKDATGQQRQWADDAAIIDTTGHSGIISYEPTELVVSVRAGTPLQQLMETLDAQGQMLPFEPPVFAAGRIVGGTIGGVIACGLSGPRRPWAGSARDYVLGTRILNGQAQALTFGGEVMKNVAGYDVSRLQVGAFGTLGLLLDVSMKVLPKPEKELTLHHRLDEADGLQSMIALARQPIPLSACMLLGCDRYVRLSGSAVAVETTASQLGGSLLDETDAPWHGLRDLTHPFFTDERPLWRLSVAAQAAAIDLPGDWLVDWGGAQRWLKTDAPGTRVFAACAAAGGHAICYGPVADATQRSFQPLNGPMLALQSRVRQSLDPHGLLNRGHFHPDF